MRAEETRLAIRQRGGRVGSEADGPESLSVPSVSGPSR